MGVRENKVERYLDRQFKDIGGLTRKWVSPKYDGVPDRLCFLNGHVWLVEVKTLDGRLSDVQTREHQRLLKVGAKVRTVFGEQGVDEFMCEVHGVLFQ